MTNDRRRGEMNEMAAADGLHILKARLQKRFLARQCAALADCLPQALAATEAAAPVRENPYVIERVRRREDLAHLEANWEEALFWELKSPPPNSPAPWRRLLTYQVNLPNRKGERAWGEIDLLGVSRGLLPVVIELKAPKSSQNPAQMLVQAAAYGVALRKAWNRCFRREWERIVPGPAAPPDELATCELVCAAPSEYWIEWTGETPRARKVTASAWAALATLREGLRSNGFPSLFVRLGHTGVDSRGGPTGITVEEERLPGR